MMNDILLALNIFCTFTLCIAVIRQGGRIDRLDRRRADGYKDQNGRHAQAMDRVWCDLRGLSARISALEPKPTEPPKKVNPIFVKLDQLSEEVCRLTNTLGTPAPGESISAEDYAADRNATNEILKSLSTATQLNSNALKYLVEVTQAAMSERTA